MTYDVTNGAVRTLIQNWWRDDTTTKDVTRDLVEDIQSIAWNKLNCSREQFRKDRLEHLMNDVPLSVKQAKEECKLTRKGGKHYSFAKCDFGLMPAIQYYLDSSNAGMLWSTSKNDVYLAASYKIGHSSERSQSVNSKSTTILDLEGHVAPSEKHPGSHMQGFSKTRISAMAVRDQLLIVGGKEGQLICKHLDRPGISFCFKPTSPQGRVNAVEIYKSLSGAIHFIASGQEGSVEIFNVETFQISRDFRLPWQVNHTSSSPDGRQLVVVGNDTKGRLMDSVTGLTIQSFHGHFGYSCTSAWHPDGRRFATGNEDRTCRIWDARNLSRSIVTLEGKVRAVTSICFTSDGEFMAMGEDLDYVHVYDVKGFEIEQEIDFFGHVSGLSFSPDTESLFIGVSMNTSPNLLMYNRSRP